MPTRDLSIASLVAANLVPLAGVLFLGWDAGAVLLAYWAENVIVGLYNELRILLAGGSIVKDLPGKVAAMAFFLIHYGGFCAIHGVFVYAFVTELGRGGAAGGADIFPDPSRWPGPLMFVGLLVNVVTTVWATYSMSIAVPVAALLASHGVSFVQHAIVRGELRGATIPSLMVRPYGRVVVLHVGILAAALPVVLLGSPWPLLAVLVGLKTAADLILHVRSHRRAPGAETGPPPPRPASKAP